jgi:uncharacterized phage protein (TIGR01671 family)
MREIKFRAWDKTLDAWIKSFMLGGNGNFAALGIDNPSQHTDIKDIIVMQYTGLKDKNGKEVYEGDIVGYEEYSDMVSVLKKQFTEQEAKEEYKTVGDDDDEAFDKWNDKFYEEVPLKAVVYIDYDADRACYAGRTRVINDRGGFWDQDEWDDNSYYDLDGDSLDVIGNIYENPELIKKVSE